MKHRLVTREEAEGCYTSELAGKPFRFGEGDPGVIVAVKLPEHPIPGGVAGKGILPLTYEYQVDGRTHTLITRDGPEVDELRAFLRATLEDYRFDERLELWFEDGETLGDGCGCGCGC